MEGPTSARPPPGELQEVVAVAGWGSSGGFFHARVTMSAAADKAGV